MVGEQTQTTVERTRRHEPACSKPLVLARATVPSLLVHLAAAWLVLGEAPSPMPQAETDAHLDGALTVVTIEAQPAKEPEPAGAHTETGSALSDLPKDIACCAPADHSVRKSRAPADRNTITQAPPQQTDAPQASEPWASPPLHVERPAGTTATARAETAPTAAKTPWKTGSAEEFEAATVAAEAAAGREALAHPPAGTPAHVSPGVAASLRVYDTFPRMPEPLRSSPRPHLVVMNVCVSAEGRVDDVRFGVGANQMLARTLREAVNTWRYRPLMLGEGPTPFCHEMGVQYRVR